MDDKKYLECRESAYSSRHFFVVSTVNKESSEMKKMQQVGLYINRSAVHDLPLLYAAGRGVGCLLCNFHVSLSHFRGIA